MSKLLIKSAELCDLLVERVLPADIAKIIKQHAIVAVILIMLPSFGLEVFIGVASLWIMYLRVNKLVGNKSIMHTIGAGMLTNIIMTIVVYIISSALSVIPGIAAIPNIALAILQYWLITACGCAYIESLIRLFRKKNVKHGNYSDSFNSVYKENEAVINSLKEQAKNSLDQGNINNKTNNHAKI